MGQPIIECVPNFSEGRNHAKLEAILEVIRATEGVDLLDVDPGFDTNRTVVTFVGSPAAVAEAAFRAIRKAAEVIDMRKHKGAHPRHGATDVCPFVPVADATMADCIRIAEEVGERVGRELDIPVYLYDQAAKIPERRSLAFVRQGEYEALPDKLSRPEWKPDFGPAELRPGPGVVTIGAREFLIAYNVSLNSREKSHATDLAFEIREKGRAVRRDQTNRYYESGEIVRYWPSKNIWPSGLTAEVFESLDQLEAHYREHGRDLHDDLKAQGRDPEKLEGVSVFKPGRFQKCRAVGWTIPEYHRAQISINLTDFEVTPPHAVLEACRELARERGLVVTGSEVVGLIPWAAIQEAGEFYLKQQGQSRGMPVADIIETAVQSLGLRDVGEFDTDKAILGRPERKGPLATMPVDALADEVSRSSPAPGGGSIAALAGSLGASLASMVANLTHPDLVSEAADAIEDIAIKAQDLKDRLLEAIDADTDAFGDVLAARRMPQDSGVARAAREEAIQKGYQSATEVPMRTAELCLEALRLCRPAAELGKAASITDAGVGALMAHAGLHGALYNVRINLSEITDEAWVEDIRKRLGGLAQEGDRLVSETRKIVDRVLEGD
ncbi:MAG: glutamate formimidoyltransferase [Planctomycetota bacterium]